MSSCRIRDSSLIYLLKGVPMKNRTPTNRPIDRKIFRNTAVKVKAVNLPQKAYRGGIRF